jgi:rfaE bifunctional protein nucleotidyltransferase chain/domain
MIWTNGCFDLLHAGHVDYLNKAARLGDLIVGITSDKTLMKEKGRIIIPEDERALIVSNLACVKGVVIVDNVARILENLKPDVYVKGGDYNIETINQEERKVVESYGGKIAFIPVVRNISTTKIIDKIRK